MNSGIFFASASGILYGTLGLFGVYLLREGIELNEFLFWRFTLAVIILLPFLNKKQHWKDIFSKRGLIAIGISSIFYASSTNFYFYSIEYIGSGLAMVLFYCYPVFVILLDWVHGKNKPGYITIKGLLIVLMGTLFLSDPSNWNLSLEGLGWGLFCAFGFGVYFYSSQMAVKKLSVLSSTFCICFGNFLTFLLTIIWKGHVIIPNTAWVIGNIVGLSILSTVLPIYLVYVALKTIDSTKASLLSVFEPIVTIILGIIFLQETIAPIQYIGAMIILFGVYMVQGYKKVADSIESLQI